jgi:hypothetical protein
MNTTENEAAAEDRVMDENTTIPENTETNPTKTSKEVEEQSQAVMKERLSGVFDEDESEEEEPEEEERTFKTISRSLEELPTDSIQHFSQIPDFVIPTAAAHPIIIRTTEGNFCIDGWSLVEAAIAEGKTSILSEVDELDSHSNEELCLRKGGIRSLTRGGLTTYPEMIRNAVDLLAMLLSSDDDLRIYGHGQKRYGEGFVNNREEDVRHILAIRLGRDRDTINLYLCHGEYLSSDVLKIFADRRAPKRFFEKTQAKKRIELKNQKGKNLSIGRITEAISTFMLKEFAAFLVDEENRRRKTKVATSTETKIDNHTETMKDPVPADDNDDVDDEPEPDKDTPELNPEESVTTEKIFRTYDGVSKRIAEDVSKGISIPKMETRLKEELKVITQLLNMIAHLSDTGK